MNRTTRFALPVVGGITALILTACGSSSSGSGTGGTPGTQHSPSAAAQPSTTGQHNAADVTFATGMIPHHTQAIQMAQMAIKQADNANLRQLAAMIKAAQQPEIVTMSSWLTAWRQPVPATGSGHDMGGMDMGGSMMTGAEMTALGKAGGIAFDRMWLQLMTKHHQGAVTMAKTELTSGSYPAAKNLAQSIIDSQTAEIAQMKTLLTTLG